MKTAEFRKDSAGICGEAGRGPTHLHLTKTRVSLADGLFVEVVVDFLTDADRYPGSVLRSNAHTWHSWLATPRLPHSKASTVCRIAPNRCQPLRAMSFIYNNLTTHNPKVVGRFNPAACDDGASAVGEVRRSCKSSLKASPKTSATLSASSSRAQPSRAQPLFPWH
jgi:hypothetical protein